MCEVSSHFTPKGGVGQTVLCSRTCNPCALVHAKTRCHPPTEQSNRARSCTTGSKSCRMGVGPDSTRISSLLSHNLHDCPTGILTWRTSSTADSNCASARLGLWHDNRRITTWSNCCHELFALRRARQTVCKLRVSPSCPSQPCFYLAWSMSSIIPMTLHWQVCTHTDATNSATRLGRLPTWCTARLQLGGQKQTNLEKTTATQKHASTHHSNIQHNNGHDCKNSGMDREH